MVKVWEPKKWYLLGETLRFVDVEMYSWRLEDDSIASRRMVVARRVALDGCYTHTLEEEEPVVLFTYTTTTEPNEWLLLNMLERFPGWGKKLPPVRPGLMRI